MEKEKEEKKRVESFRPFRLELALAAGKASKLFPDALTLSCEHPFKEPIDCEWSSKANLIDAISYIYG